MSMCRRRIPKHLWCKSDRVPSCTSSSCVVENLRLFRAYNISDTPCSCRKFRGPPGLQRNKCPDWNANMKVVARSDVFGGLSRLHRMERLMISFFPRIDPVSVGQDLIQLRPGMRSLS
eukprot:gnl/TRDRNA2_/TRDRNA2_164400_c1_seq1.p1 gnl/TRDRNA2_/TRDRNA2_164400_c1~~gnl/TRDRNA2_/TRDRNA2_164400_c1_seq1.p1  ORF type:complete len:118 (-),score=3.39 gnl/TRDRNA2_/TRDRNA2_164400_c1_seq1:125-478(-)